jgi:hypothetical protein
MVEECRHVCTHFVSYTLSGKFQEILNRDIFRRRDSHDHGLAERLTALTALTAIRILFYFYFLYFFSLSKKQIRESPSAASVASVRIRYNLELIERR